jgi:hypothetical protein
MSLKLNLFHIPKSASTTVRLSLYFVGVFGRQRPYTGSEGGRGVGANSNDGKRGIHLYLFLCH